MFIFPRRVVQQQLDSLAATLSGEQLSALIGRLNRPGQDRLAAFWEILFLFSLSQVGSVRHEVKLSNGCKPDLDYTPHDKVGRGFIADVTTISDAGLDKANPVRTFADELERLARKVGINPNHLQYHVLGKQEGSFRNSKTTLMLPKAGDLPKVLQNKVWPFLKNVKKKNAVRDQLTVEFEGVAFSVTVDLTQRFMSGGYQSYTAATSIKKNPLWNKLREKAEDQLKDVQTDKPIGIVVCDGGCDLLRHQARGPHNYRADEIARQFLRQYSSIDFVLLVTVEVTRDIFTASQTKKFAVQLVMSDGFDGGCVLASIFDRAFSVLPRPTLDAMNASLQCHRKDYGLGHLGGYSMGGSSIRISARSLADLLAGRISQDRFNEAHGWDAAAPHQRNYFLRQIEQGRMISSISLEKDNKYDDDWIAFEFGEPDPAISPFKMPSDVSTSRE